MFFQVEIARVRLNNCHKKLKKTLHINFNGPKSNFLVLDSIKIYVQNILHLKLNYLKRELLQVNLTALSICNWFNRLPLMLEIRSLVRWKWTVQRCHTVLLHHCWGMGTVFWTQMDGEAVPNRDYRLQSEFWKPVISAPGKLMVESLLLINLAFNPA